MKSSGVSPQSWKMPPNQQRHSNSTQPMPMRRPLNTVAKDTSKTKPGIITEFNEGTGIDKAQIEPQEFSGIPGQLRFDLEHRQGDQYKPGMIQIFAQNWWTKREYRAVYGDADAIRIVKKPLKFVYQLLTKALSGESKSATVTCSVIGGIGTSASNLALLVSIVVKSEFDESTYDFKLPDVLPHFPINHASAPAQMAEDASILGSVTSAMHPIPNLTYDTPMVTSVADGSRLQDMILDLRQDHMRVTERATNLESENQELKDRNSSLEGRVLQMERQISILLGDHEQHMLPLLEGFKATNEGVYGPVFARREGRRCVLNGLVTGSSPRGDHEGGLMLVLPDSLWPPFRLIFNGSYCTSEGHFCQYSVHVCRNGQVKALTYGKIMSMNLNVVDFWID